MNPNNVNRFAHASVGVSRKRSTFNRNSKVMTTFDSGLLVPLYWDEILPGDNIKIKLNGVCRGLTPLFPVMDNSYFDVYAFFVPNRLVYEDWEQFMGDTSDNVENPFLPEQEYLIPQIKIAGSARPTSSVRAKVDILSYLGVPPASFSPLDTVSVSALPVRAYCKIWNEWFRDENFQLPIIYEKGSVDVSYLDSLSPLADDFMLSASKGGALAPVNKFKDYFVSALPSPQRGNAVSLSLVDVAPVVTGSVNDNYLSQLDNTTEPLRFGLLSNGATFQFPEDGPTLRALFYGNDNGQDVALKTCYNVDNEGPNLSDGSAYNFDAVPVNLYTNLADATSITVNQMRLAFQTQKYLETLARGGCRYIETLYSLYGVKTSDARLQRSEYLGGKRIPITMQQVAQTSGTTSDSVLGDTGAFSLTTFSNNLCDHFFEEHGILMLVGCCRTDQTYSQGISRQWLRKTRFDYYAPVFANLGEMPIYNKEIYYDGTENDDLPFGYQEAWAEYRFKPNICTGLLNPTVDGNLSAWTYALKFASCPVLNSDFIKQSADNVSQTLAVQGERGSQFICDLYVENKSTRVMPMYSVPGLIDHS